MLTELKSSSPNCLKMRFDLQTRSQEEESSEDTPIHTQEVLPRSHTHTPFDEAVGGPSSLVRRSQTADRTDCRRPETVHVGGTHLVRKNIFKKPIRASPN